jgi:putative selenate reductase
MALGRDVTLAGLRRDYAYVFLGVGAQKGKRLGIPHEDAPGVLDALAFLDKVRSGAPMELGKRVLVIGGGNSAMDAARSARRLVKDGEVTLVYRRTRAEMPADPAEVADCIEEGIGLRDLLAPAAIAVAGGRAVGLLCTKMRLGERDASGRPRPVPVDGPGERVEADTIIAAISQEPVLDFLEGLDVRREQNGTLAVDPMTRETSLAGLFAGGDAVHGPASVIQAIADGRAAAEAIGRRHGLEPAREPQLDKGLAVAGAMAKKSRTSQPQTVPVLPLTEREGFAEVIHAFSAEAAALEASRCLDCDDLCSLCVTVCPNRANVAYAVEPFTLQLPRLVVQDGRLVASGTREFRVDQAVQTLNVGDFCNECGNCNTFCPAAGAPYRDKPKFWLDEEGFREAKGDAYHMANLEGALSLQARLAGESHTLRVRDGKAVYSTAKVTASFQAPAWELLHAEAQGALPEGAEVDLGPCATLLGLLFAQAELPGM